MVRLVVCVCDAGFAIFPGSLSDASPLRRSVTCRATSNLRKSKLLCLRISRARRLYMLCRSIRGSKHHLSSVLTVVTAFFLFQEYTILLLEMVACLLLLIFVSSTIRISRRIAVLLAWLGLICAEGRNLQKRGNSKRSQRTRYVGSIRLPKNVVRPY
jgi:hypothetical protein